MMMNGSRSINYSGWAEWARKRDEEVALQIPTGAAVDLMARALRAVEFVHSGDAYGSRICPWCYGYAGRHSVTCIRQAALAALEAEKEMKVEAARLSLATRSYVCPECSCGCVSDKEDAAILRCTGCHQKFSPADTIE